MISHKYKCIFIHIPKTAGTSIYSYFFPEVNFNHAVPDYEILYGWCPKRKIHMQHATSNQLIQTKLIPQDLWKTYFKFTFVRNPWDRALSDYFWLMRDRKIHGSFNDYLSRSGVFEKVLNDFDKIYYRGEHILPQTSFFSIDEIDFMGRFESLNDDMEKLRKILGIPHKFDKHEQKGQRGKKHYSIFYTGTKRRMVEEKFALDIDVLNYDFVDKKKGFMKLLNCF